MKKGQGMSFNTIVKIILAVLVLTTIVIFFTGGIKKLASSFQKLFIITLGPEGSMAYDVDKTYFAPSLPVKKIIDTTGAGDAFAAAFTKKYLKTKNRHDNRFIWIKT